MPTISLAWLAPLALAGARAAPTVLLVPAFGLRALPAPARAFLAIALAACIVPALEPATGYSHGRLAGTGPDDAGPWALLALTEMVRGLPVAIAAAVPLWAATMAGGVADALRGYGETINVPVVEGRPTPLGVPMSLLASAIFLATGGPARAALALAIRPAAPNPLVAAAADIAQGISLAVALGGPLLAAGVVVEVAAALIARAAAPAQVHALLAPLRALATLAVMALVLERLATVLAIAVRAAP